MTSRLLSVLLFLALCSQALAAESVTVSLDFDPPAVAPGGKTEGRVVFQMAPGYHVYGPGEELGIPTKVKISAPAGVTAGEPIYPPPKRVNFELLGGELNLYEGQLVVRFPVTIAAGAKPGNLAIEATVDYQACTDEICERPREDVKLAGTLAVQAGAPGGRSASVELGSTATEPRSPDVAAGHAGLPSRPETSASPASGPPGARPILELGPTAPDPARSAGLPPAAKDSESSTPDSPGARPILELGPTAPDPARSAGLPPAAASPPPPAPAAKKDAFAEKLEQGLFWVLLAAFGWGIAASFSPCVYPMIPITISYFGSQAKGGGTRARRVSLAATYVLGMTLTYSILGVVAARLGQDLGAWMVNPWVIGTLSVLLVALACSMFGLYVLQLPSWITSRFETGDRGGYLEALVMGLALGFVAAPCVGPFAGSILVFVARSGDIGVGFLTLFTFGLGMGVLFLIIAFTSGSIVPRSGAWLLAVEHFFGYVMIGMAIYLMSNILPPWLTTWTLGAYLLLGGTFLGAFSPLAPDAPGKTLMAKGLGAIGVLMGATAIVAGTLGSGLLGEQAVPAAAQPAAAHDDRWLRSLDEAMAEAKRTGKPIFADFYADWCIPCKLMDRTTFKDPAVLEALSAFVLVKVDCTDPKSPGARYKNEVLKAANMPYLAFFDSTGKHSPELSIEGYAETPKFLEAVNKAKAALSPSR